MLTREEARDIVLRKLAPDSDPDDPLVVTGVYERATCFLVSHALQSDFEEEPEEPGGRVYVHAPYIVAKSTGQVFWLPTYTSLHHFVRAFERVGDPRAADRPFPCTLHISLSKENARPWGARKRLLASGLVGWRKSWTLVRRVMKGETVALPNIDYRAADQLARGLVRMGYDVAFSTVDQKA